METLSWWGSCRISTLRAPNQGGTTGSAPTRKHELLAPVMHPDLSCCFLTKTALRAFLNPCLPKVRARRFVAELRRRGAPRDAENAEPRRAYAARGQAGENHLRDRHLQRLRQTAFGLAFSNRAARRRRKASPSPSPKERDQLVELRRRLPSRRALALRLHRSLPSPTGCE